MSKIQARNEAVINASVGNIWAVITNINLLHKINPGVVKAAGAMDKLGSTRICDMDNDGKKGTMTERLVEIVPGKKTVWALEGDTMGMSKMLKNANFVFHLEKLGEKKTKVTNETYYEPANFIAAIMNRLMMKKMISKAQEQILQNIKSLSER